LEQASVVSHPKCIDEENGMDISANSDLLEKEVMLPNGEYPQVISSNTPVGGMLGWRQGPMEVVRLTK
jgi:hypothetical protein